MTDKEFRSLKRSELIDIIYQYQKQEVEMQNEIAELKKQLEDRSIKIKNAGSIAEAIVDISGILEATQKMADDYLAAIKENGEEMKKDYMRKLMKYDDKVEKLMQFSDKE